MQHMKIRIFRPSFWKGSRESADRKLFYKTDIVTGEPVEGAKLQILDEEGTVVREWITTKEEHLEYALPAGNYILHEELPPLEDGYVSAEDVSFEVKEDGTITKVEMKDDFQKWILAKRILLEIPSL